MPTTSWPCVIDPTRPCGLCAAPWQELCPYPYLLAGDEPAAVVPAAEPEDGTETVQPDETSRESGAVQVWTAGPSSLT